MNWQEPTRNHASLGVVDCGRRPDGKLGYSRAEFSACCWLLALFLEGVLQDAKKRFLAWYAANDI